MSSESEEPKIPQTYSPDKCDVSGRLVNTEGNPNSTTHSYDASGNLVAIQTGGRTVQNTYDPDGNLVAVESGGRTVQYSYDAVGRRVAATDARRDTTKYQYYASGNILAVDDRAKPSADPNEDCLFDRKDNLVVIETPKRSPFASLVAFGEADLTAIGHEAIMVCNNPNWRSGLTGHCGAENDFLDSLESIVQRAGILEVFREICDREASPIQLIPQAQMVRYACDLGKIVEVGASVAHSGGSGDVHNLPLAANDDGAPVYVNDKDSFAARVHGNAMEPKYRAGDIVIFSPAAHMRDGDDCFIRFDDGQTTFKRVFFETDADGNSTVRLQPRNERYRPQVVPAERVPGIFRAIYTYHRAVEEEKSSPDRSLARGEER